VKCTVYASFRPSTTTSRWLPVKWPHFWVTSGHQRSSNCISYHVTASSCELQPCKSEMYSIHQLSTFHSHFRVTSGQITSLPGHFRSPVVTWHHFVWHAASSCELHPCRKWNIQYTPVFGLLQTVPGDFRSNDGASVSLPITWGHVTSFPVTWLPPPASYTIVKGEMYSIRQFLAFYSHFQVTSSQMTSFPGDFWSPEVTWGHLCHVTASPCELQPCR